MNSRRLTPAVFLLVDSVSLFVLFNVLCYVRGVIDWPNFLLWSLLPPWTFTVVGLYLIDGYKTRTDMLSVDYTSQHSIAIIASMMATLLLTFVLLPYQLPLQGSRAVIVLAQAAFIPLSLGIRRSFKKYFLKSEAQKSLVFIGDAPSCQAFLEECSDHKVRHPVLICSLERSWRPENPVDFTCSSQDLEQTLEMLGDGRCAAEAIIVRETAQSIPPGVMPALMNLYLAGIPSYTLERFHQVYWRNIPLYRLNQTWLFQAGFLIAREPAFERAKRLSDVILASIGLILASPVLLLAALAIKLEDKGPVFFRQTRIGKNNVPFSIYKLRSMRINDPSQARYTTSDDRRITRVGKILRLTRLDEVPQFLNVLKGEMSMIGPRAEWDILVSDYEKQIPCYHFRHMVKPGITGWAQINYPYGASMKDTLRKLEYDLYYIRFFSFRLDAAIVLKTIHVMLFGRGR